MCVLGYSALVHGGEAGTAKACFKWTGQMSQVVRPISENCRFEMPDHIALCPYTDYCLVSRWHTL